MIQRQKPLSSSFGFSTSLAGPCSKLHDGFIPYATSRRSAICLAQRRQSVLRCPDAPARFPPCYRCSGAGFYVDNNLQRGGDVCAAIDKNMAHANPAGNHRNGGLPAAQFMQACAAARDQSYCRCTYPYAAFIDQRTVRLSIVSELLPPVNACFQRLLNDTNGCGTVRCVFPPRRITALPVFRHKEATSTA